MWYLQEKGHLLETECNQSYILPTTSDIGFLSFTTVSYYCIIAQSINHFFPFWQLYFKSTDVYNERWQNAWIIPAFWQVLSFSLLCIICALWAPSQNSMRYYPASTLLCVYMHFTEFSQPDSRRIMIKTLDALLLHCHFIISAFEQGIHAKC